MSSAEVYRQGDMLQGGAISNPRSQNLRQGVPPSNSSLSCLPPPFLISRTDPSLPVYVLFPTMKQPS